MLSKYLLRDDTSALGTLSVHGHSLCPPRPLLASRLGLGGQMLIVFCPPEFGILMKLLSSEDEIVVGNAALCLGNCVEVPYAALPLLKTDIVQVLLRHAGGDAQKTAVQLNAGIALAKLCTAEPRYVTAPGRVARVGHIPQAAGPAEVPCGGRASVSPILQGELPVPTGVGPSSCFPAGLGSSGLRSERKILLWQGCVPCAHCRGLPSILLPPAPPASRPLPTHPSCFTFSPGA